MNLNFFSFVLNHEEGFIELNPNLLETNVINILILLGLLIYGYKVSFSVTLQDRQKEIVQMLLKANADVNTMNSKGCNPIFVATHENHGDIVRMLVEAKADVNIKNKNGCSPIFIACQQNHCSIVQMLLNA